MKLDSREFQTQNETDWETAQTLYVVTGLTARQIKLSPDFSHLSQSQIERRAYEGGWDDKREKFLNSKIAVLGHTIADQMKRGAESFRSAISHELETEISMYQSRPKGKSANDQKERLDLLVRIVNMGDKIYPVDQFQIPDASRQGYQGLTQVNISMGAGANMNLQASPARSLPLSAVSTLGDSESKTTGNLDASEGSLVGAIEFKIHQPEVIESEEAIELEAIQTGVSDEEAIRKAQEIAGYGKEEQVVRKEAAKKRPGGGIELSFSGGEDKQVSGDKIEEARPKKACKKRDV